MAYNHHRKQNKENDLRKRNDKLERANRKLQEELNALKKPKDASRQHKDRLFRFIFGNAAHKDWTLSLYNAINGSHYADPEIIDFNTIEDVLYLGMKNDVSFILDSTMNIYEHQSTFNPNEPMRCLLYCAPLVSKYIETNDLDIYSSTLQKIPAPRLILFYNGTRNQPERSDLRLSDAYQSAGKENDLDATVHMININFGYNSELMRNCQPLYEYAWLINEIRTNQDQGNTLDTAVDLALAAMANDFILKPFLLGNKAEVKTMLLTEYDEEKILANKYKEGEKEGKEIGIKEERLDVAFRMIRSGCDFHFIVNMTQLPEKQVQELMEQVKSEEE